MFCIQRPVSSLLDEDSTKSSIHEDQVKIGMYYSYTLKLFRQTEIILKDSTGFVYVTKSEKSSQ